MPENLGRLSVAVKTGEETFHEKGEPMGFDLMEFWRWSVSDLVSNATRGVLAEYIVAKALQIPTNKIRNEWDAYDLLTATGLRIQVKSAAFVQTWHQAKLSSVLFSVKPTRGWDAETNIQSKQAMRHADVYVFALLAHKDKPTIDPLDVSQWRFYVVRSKTLDQRTRSKHSITLKSLDTLTGGPVEYKELAKAIERASEGASNSPSAI